MASFLSGVCMYKKCTEYDHLCKERYCEQHCHMYHGADHTYPDQPPTKQDYCPMAPVLVAMTEEL